MTLRFTRPWAAAALSAGALIASTGLAHAQLGLPLGGLGQIVTDVGTTVGGALPAGGGVVTGATGTGGGIVTGTTGTVTGAVDQVLDGAGDGLLGGGALDSLLGTLGVVPGAPGGAGGAGGAGGPAGTVIGGAGSGAAGSLIDARSPNVKLTVLSRLSRIAKTGRIPLKVTTDEAGIVAFRGSVRPGKALEKSRRAARKAAAAKPIRFPSAVLAYRRAGSLRVTIQLSRSAQRRLGKVRNARMSLNFVTADVRRNQGRATIKRTVRR